MFFYRNKSEDCSYARRNLAKPTLLSNNECCRT